MPLNHSAFRAADEAYRRGDSVSDAELALLIRHYTLADEGLRAVCTQPTYRLAEMDVGMRLRELQGFQHARRGRVTL